MTAAGSNVLIVEDDGVVRRLLIEYLKRHAWVNVDGARDGVEALHWISQGDYSVIILDLNMPKMSGTDVIDSLKSQISDESMTALQRLPAVIVITAEPDEDVPSELLIQRCALVRSVFRKPLDIAAVGECVEQFLRSGGIARAGAVV